MTYTASKLIELYWEYSQPKVKMIRPRGFERPGEKKGGVKFEAWLRVVTEPNYPEHEKHLRSGFDCPEFEASLTESLKVFPFVVKDEDDGSLYGAMVPLTSRVTDGGFIPVSAATQIAGVHQTTVMRWINHGLKHEKRGAYYWVSVTDLEHWANLKRRHKRAKHFGRKEEALRLAS